MKIEEIYKQLSEVLKKSKIILKESMKEHTSFKIGGEADIFIKASDIEDIKSIVKYGTEHSIPINVIGNGSNLLVKDNGIRGITMQVDLQNIEIEEKQDNGKIIVKAGAGVKLGYLGNILAKNEITGFEFATGIPGSIGGAVRMNAGAFGKEIKDILKQATYMQNNGEIVTLPKEQMNLSYRHSRFIDNSEIILACEMELQQGKKEDILAKIQEYALIRKEKQPLDMPSAGSTFKRGNNFITAQLIDEAGLKGYSIGGAEVSTKHAGFIVNKGGATAEDILNLVDYITKVIFEKFGKVIELEVEVIGED